MMSATVEIPFALNGRPVRARVPIHMSTLTMLREVLGHTGTKYACGEGECGACTVIVDGLTLNSCLMYAVECEGREITTIEGLRSAEALHPLQQSFVDHGAIQCGYCMPGMILQAKHIVDKNPGLTRQQLARGLEGNVCRCTGYQKVFEAVAAAAGVEI